MQRLKLSNLKNTRATLGGLIREFHKEEPDVDEFPRWRLLFSAMSDLIKAHKAEKEVAIEKRLEEVERILKNQGFKG